MSGTTKAIERSELATGRIRPNGGPDWYQATPRQATRLRQNDDRKLVAEWQRGAEIPGHAQRKLRLNFTPTQLPTAAMC
jgi:hypothetical protein